MYHTQEKRNSLLNSPIPCTRNDAWLGDGCYFWDEEVDAIHWGNNSKRGTGYFQIYKASINMDNVLNTVFNEDHYRFWLKQIEKAAKVIAKKTGLKPTIKEINQYFKDRSKWEDVAQGILFQDLPIVEDLMVLKLNYRKRIQLVAYSLDIIKDFSIHEEMKCDK